MLSKQEFSPEPSASLPFGNPSVRLERVPVAIFGDSKLLALQVAKRIQNLIESKRAAGEFAVLGLPTGSTPIGVYQQLKNLHNNEALDFANVVTFNLDEYYPMHPDSLQSYKRFMDENLFNHVNIDPSNVHIPSGTVAREKIEEHCQAYEREIQKMGGIDLMLLGIGRSGHIGFNEPGSEIDDRTRLIVLDEITRKDAASDFFEERYVPREAITMGVGTILEAKEIILIATGEHKAPIIRRAVEEKQTADVSATFLQLHPNTTFFLDRAAASALTREKTPWMVSSTVSWTRQMAKRAVIWLSEKVGKPIGHLDASDFHRNHLHELVHQHGDVDSLCQMVFEDLRRRVRYRESLPSGETILVFSPHPDDDVISMGGMLSKLVRNGNNVTVAYMTNGSVAVFDSDVRRHVRFLEMTDEMFGWGGAQADQKYKQILAALEAKQPAQVDTVDVQKLKANIRYTEAIAAVEVMGLSVDDTRFLDLPFYKTGRVRKDPIGPEDVRIVLSLFDELNPAHIFVAGDLSDPHGTHRMCYGAIASAVGRYRSTTGEEPSIWLYRGAWQEWGIDEADVFVPLSKNDLEQKIEAIFKHESQKDRALFPGAYDEREFWERARDRNRETARRLDALGLPAFFAAEAYVVVDEM